MKNLTTTPIKSPSPDIRAGNKIIATKSPKNGSSKNFTANTFIQNSYDEK